MNAMKIDFSTVEENMLPKFKGGEKALAARMFSDSLNKIMMSRLEPGASIGMHTHADSSEIMLIMSGRGYAVYDGGRIDLRAGDVHYCPKGHTHCLVNDGNEDLRFFAVVPQQ